MEIVHVIEFIVVFLISCKVSAFNPENSENVATISKLFNANKNDKCAVDGMNVNCNNEGQSNAKSKESNQIKVGPKFQKVHLELPRINPIRKGHVRKINIIEEKFHKMETLSIYPPIFEIKNFLSPDECDAIIELAEEKGMRKPAAAIKELNLPDENKHSAFDKWDHDLDGALSLAEVSAIDEIKHLLLTNDDIIKMYQELGISSDTNGKISYGELEKLTFSKFKDHLKKLNEIKANFAVNQIEQTWLWHDEDELLVFDDVFQNYHQRLSNLTRIPTKIIEQSEPLQITKFKNGSFAECRHDSDQFYPDSPCCVFGSTAKCRMCRFISVMYFLNDVADGELLFPLADNKTYHWDDLHRHTSQVCSKAPNISLSNLVIKPEKGKAIMWYNHYIGRDTGWMSSLDPLSFYGSNKVGNTDKWVATTWINIIGDGVNELRPWRMGSNWLSENNKNKEVIDKMRNDDFIEGEPYLHDAKLTAIEEDDIDYFSMKEDAAIDRGTIDIEKEFIENNTTVKVVASENMETSGENLRKRVEDEKILDQQREKNKNGNNSNTTKSDQSGNENGRKKELKRKSSKDVIQIRSIQSNELENHDTKQNIDAKQEDSNKKSDEKNRFPDKGEGPLGPPVRNLFKNVGEGPFAKTDTNELRYFLPSGKMIENKVVMSILMLVEELSRDELEIIARTLHEKLQLACIPIMVNPIGPL